MLDIDAAEIDGLISSLAADPTRLPLAEVTAIHQAGHSLRLERSSQRVVAVVSHRRHRGFEQLTSRELQVAGLVAVGLSNRQIAGELSISLGTVKDHVHSILRKLDVESRSQAIAAWYGGLTRN